MTRLTPSLALLGLVLIGCTGDKGTNESASPDKPADASLHWATVEVKGMT